MSVKRIVVEYVGVGRSIISVGGRLCAVRNSGTRLLLRLAAAGVAGGWVEIDRLAGGLTNRYVYELRRDLGFKGFVVASGDGRYALSNSWEVWRGQCAMDDLEREPELSQLLLGLRCARALKWSERSAHDILREMSRAGERLNEWSGKALPEKPFPAVRSFPNEVEGPGAMELRRAVKGRVDE
jgi:hypothetical protein